LLAWELGFSLDEIAKLNLKKIFDRYGYSDTREF